MGLPYLPGLMFMCVSKCFLRHLRRTWPSPPWTCLGQTPPRWRTAPSTEQRQSCDREQRYSQVHRKDGGDLRPVTGYATSRHARSHLARSNRHNGAPSLHTSSASSESGEAPCHDCTRRSPSSQDSRCAFRQRGRSYDKYNCTGTVSPSKVSAVPSIVIRLNSFKLSGPMRRAVPSRSSLQPPKQTIRSCWAEWGTYAGYGSQWC
jgi:hypothetical protein